MGTLNNLLTIIVVALGPIIGYVLGRLVKEELKPGKKWFILAQHVLFVASTIVFVLAYQSLLYVLLGLLVLIVYGLFRIVRTLWFVEVLLAILFALTIHTPNSLFVSSLVFLHGLPTGSRLAVKKAWKKAAGASIVFLIVAAVLLYFV